MASAIKKFFQKRKLDVKFKKAGDGHKLAEATRQASGKTPHVPPTTPRSAPSPGPSSKSQSPSDGSQRAATAALARSEANKRKDVDPIIAARSRMRKQREAERAAIDEAEAIGAAYREGPKEVIQDAAPVLSTILFNCPDIGPMVLTKSEMEVRIEEFLLTCLADEPEMTSALMIHTFNKDKEKVKVCIDTLVKYFDNIIAHPEEEKYRKIRINNKVFNEKVASVKGSEEFMQAARFYITSLPVEDHEESFYLLSEEEAKNSERLQNLKEVLLTAEPIKPQLDRALKVFHSSASASKFDIPDEFYAISPEEMKKEQQRRTEAVEKLGMLRTKAMRERDEQRELRKYRYTLLRVKFPNGVILQGTFRAMEKLSDLLDYVRQNLCNDWMPFQLNTSTGQKLAEESLSLAELGLAPAAIVNFSWDATVAAEVTAQQGSSQTGQFLKPEILTLIQSI